MTDFLPLKKASAAIGVHRTALHRAIHSGRVHAIRPGHAWLVDMESARQAYPPNGHGRGHGKAIGWLRANANHLDDACLIWPFSRDGGNGYGRLGFEGRNLWAHRVMCELANGPAPSSKHECAHLCGRGHDGCVNPRHLRWKTREENQADRYLHSRKPKNYRYRLTPEQVSRIRSLNGKKSQAALATEFGTSQSNISLILNGGSWQTGTYRYGGFKPGDPNNPSKRRAKATAPASAL